MGPSIPKSLSRTWQAVCRAQHMHGRGDTYVHGMQCAAYTWDVRGQKTLQLEGLAWGCHLMNAPLGHTVRQQMPAHNLGQMQHVPTCMCTCLARSRGAWLCRPDLGVQHTQVSPRGHPWDTQGIHQHGQAAAGLSSACSLPCCRCDPSLPVRPQETPTKCGTSHGTEQGEGAHSAHFFS